jgi:hypothetical protein
MRLEVAGVVWAVSQLVNNGYDRKYRMKNDYLFDPALNNSLDPRHIHVDIPLRWDSGPDYSTSDEKTHNKGWLIDAFDIFVEICIRELAERLVETRCAASSCRPTSSRAANRAT